MTVWLAVVYAVVAALLTWLLTSASGDWRLKAALIVVAPALAFALWQGHLSPGGWPARTSPPDGAAFLWGAVREPTDTDRGAIFVWAVPSGSQRPRAYQLPYTRQLHKQMEQAMSQARHGGHVSVRKAKARRGQPGPRSVLRFYRHPPIGLPAKRGG